MPGYTTEQIRNVAFLGHAGAGKTLLVEALLHDLGAKPSRGDIEHGTTTCDFEPEEKAHKHSLSAAVVSTDARDYHFNFIDTPGYPDLSARAMSVLPAVETAAIVVDARAGVQPNTQRMMHAAAEQGLCRMVVVNKIDAPDADTAAVTAAIAEAFGAECLPINLPVDGGASVADCFFAPNGASTDFSSIDEAHEHLIDQVVEVDDALMEMYLEQGQDLEPEALHDAFEKALREGHLVPVCFVSAESGAGVHELSEIIERLMPHPGEGNPARFIDEGEDGDKAETLAVQPDADGPVLAHVFKVAVDNFVGRLGVFRVHQGTLSKNAQLFIGEGRKPIKVAHMFQLAGKEHVEVDAAIPGDICAIAKVDELAYDAVLHDTHDEDHVHLEHVAMPGAMFGLAIQAKKRGEEQKVAESLAKLAAEDPSLHIDHNAAVNETVLRGLGELHLRVTLEKLNSRFGVEVETRSPRIEYHESITKKAEGHYRHKKQSGGAGQFGEVYLRIAPLPRGTGFEFENAVVGGSIPSQFIPAVEKGVRQVLEEGAVAGYPMSDVKVTVYDGKHHSVDSKEIAFITAGRKAFMEAVAQAKPVVLEPIVSIAVTTPQAQMGDITGDLAQRRGRVSGTDAGAGDTVVVRADVPLGELDGYQSTLESITGGQGSYTLEPGHYEPVPAEVQKRLVEDYKPRADED